MIARTRPLQGWAPLKCQKWWFWSIRDSQGAPLTQILGLGVPEIEFWEHPHLAGRTLLRISLASGLQEWSAGRIRTSQGASLTRSLASGLQE